MNATNLAPMWVVGVGASAGGLEALTSFLRPLPENLPAAIVIVQHMSHTHPSLLVQLLARETRLPVIEIVDGMGLQNGVVHIAPPKHHVALRSDGLAVLKPAVGRVPTPSVDDFFCSIAESCGANSIGVVLSGTGSDGAAGMRAIRYAGGHTYAQDPETAKYSGMPVASIDGAVVDSVLPPERIGAQLLRLIQTGESMPVVKPEIGLSPMMSLFQRLRRRTGIDFEGYKSATFERRLARRLAATRTNSIDDYLAHIDRHPEELDKLHQELLISVTNFFRDRASFARLAEATRAMLKEKGGKEEIRVWVAGCATGEEAYSVAIVILEALRELNGTAKLRVFATDVDMQALQKARRGVYAQASVERMPADYVERYFTLSNGHAEARPLLRDCVTFAKHSLASDPPFLRSDIVSCRNVLIYFQSALQAKVIPVLHYALEPGGLLFLGKSESVGPFDELFEMVDRAAHLYRSRGTRAVPPPLLGHAMRPELVRKGQSAAEQLQSEHLKLTLERYVPPSVLVTREGEVVHTMGDVSPYFGFPSGRPTLSILNVVRPELRMDVQTLQHRALREAGRVKGHSHQTEAGGSFRMVAEAVSVGARDLLLIAFERVCPAPGDGTGDQLAGMPHERDGELIALRENLQTVVEEMETQNEEMQALNEELQSTNEELQSTNEELETSNEELQSTNEELSTVNDELERKTSEVSAVNDDVLTLLGSLAFPVVMLDDRLRVTRTNAAAMRMFDLTPQAGLSPEAIVWPAGFGEVRDCVERTLASRSSSDAQVEIGGRHFSTVTVPCRMPSRDAYGVVLQLVDVTVLTSARQKLAVSEAHLRAVMDNSSMAVMIADANGHIEYANANFSKLVSRPVVAVLGVPFWSLFAPDEQDGLKRRHIGTLATLETSESDDLIQRSAGPRHVHSVWIPIHGTGEGKGGVCWKALDTSEQHAAREALEKSEALNRAVLTGMPAIMAVLDKEGRIVSVNDAWRQFSAENGGNSPAGWVGENYLDYCGPVEPETLHGVSANAGLRDVLQGRREIFELEYPCHSPNKERWFRMLAVPLNIARGGAAVLHVDVTALREAHDALARANTTLEATVAARTQELRQALDELEMFTFTVSHDLRSPLRTLIGFSELAQLEAGDQLNAEIVSYLDRIKVAAQRMNGYLDELLKLSHLTRGDLLVTRVDVSAMAREIGDEQRSRALGRRVDFLVADDLAVNADANLIRAVFENLIGNAWKYTRPRDHARIEVGKMVRDGADVIYVRDNGVGFDMSYRDKLFMPFQRLHDAGEFEGSGLGLAAAKRIVVRHGGALEADARPDFGATFYLRLP